MADETKLTDEHSQIISRLLESVEAHVLSTHANAENIRETRRRMSDPKDFNGQQQRSLWNQFASLRIVCLMLVSATTIATGASVGIEHLWAAFQSKDSAVQRNANTKSIVMETAARRDADQQILSSLKELRADLDDYRQTKGELLAVTRALKDEVARLEQKEGGP